MNNENFHPVLPVPPAAHALHHWDPERGVLTYEYNGTTILQVEVPPHTDLGFRHGSDGSMQSVQYVQQVYLSAEPACTARITLRAHDGALNLRPRRAGREEAILGAVPGRLEWGVNGFYDPQWDILLDWHGKDWHWLQQSARREADGFVSASFEAPLDLQALYINIRPRFYGRHLGYTYHKPWQRRPSQVAVAGWCSWEAYRRDISQDKIERMAEFLARNLAPYGLSYLQVDDGYQAMPLPVKAEMTMPEGWMTCDSEKFPGGHDTIVGAIREQGLVPAVWVNANITNPDFPKQHPEAVIWNGDEALKGEWIDFLYNCTPETLAVHVEPLFRALREKGYRYVKIDAIRHLLFDGLHECVRLGLMSDEEAQAKFRAYMEATRRGLGEEVYYLASWGEMHEVVGLVDACRISMDANPTWAGVRMQLFESARWFHTHRILFLNDPDHVCVRTKPEWARSVLSLISLSGELCMLSDTESAYTEEKLDILHKTLPPLRTSTGETGRLPLEYAAYTWTKLHGFAVQSHETPVEMEDVSAQEAANIAGCLPDGDALHPFSSLWSFPVVHHGLAWRVMLRVATVPLRAGRLPLSALALDPDKTYVAFDFWKQAYLGEVRGSFDCPALELGCCQAVAFYEKPAVPTVIASDRHVSMDAVSVLEHVWTGDTLHLRLQGVPGQTCHYHIWAPDGISPDDLHGSASLRKVGPNRIELKISFDAQEKEIDIRFQNK